MIPDVAFHFNTWLTIACFLTLAGLLGLIAGFWYSMYRESKKPACDLCGVRLGIVYHKQGMELCRKCFKDSEHDTYYG